jgi:hypothetical protein
LIAISGILMLGGDILWVLFPRKGGPDGNFDLIGQVLLAFGGFGVLFLGLIVRALSTRTDPSRPRGPARRIVLWAAVGLCVSLILSMMLDWSLTVCGVVGAASGTLLGALISRSSAVS